MQPRNRPPADIAAAPSRTFFGRRRSSWRWFAWRSRELCPDGAQDPDSLREGIAIVLDDLVEFFEERRRLLVGKVEMHAA